MSTARATATFLLLVACACGKADAPGAAEASVAVAGDVAGDVAGEGKRTIAAFARLHAASPAPIDTRTPTELEQAACQGPRGWYCARVRPVLAAAGATQAIFPASWTVANWYVDPANSSGVASDANSCTTSSAPCLTKQEISVHRWGCFGAPRACPRLQQDTTIHLLSSEANTSDLGAYFPSLEKASLIFECALGAAQTVGTGTLSATVAKNRATPQLLNTTLLGGLTPGLLVSNATHSSYAWTYRNTAGNAWSMTQPLAPITVPVWAALGAPAEVDTWANTDAVTVYQPVKINLSDLEPVYAATAAGFTNGIFVHRCQIDAPGDVFPAPITLGTSVALVESSSTRVAVYTATDQSLQTNAALNAYVLHGYSTGAYYGNAADIFVLAGSVGDAAGDGTINQPGQYIFDSDVIFGGSNSYDVGGQFGQVYVDTSSVLVIQGAGRNFLTTSINGGTAILWGPGALAVLDGLRYSAGAGAAAAAIKLTGTLKLMSGTKACLNIPSAASTFTACNKTVSAANLDTDLGTTSGCYTAASANLCNF